MKRKESIQLEKLKIGNITQWISTMGNPENDILLVLHGGPGLVGMPIYNSCFQKLTEKLLIANWDQRGAGKSYSPFIPTQSMNLEQFISDGVEVIQHLKIKFKKDKIYILGHSWGSALGMLLCQRCPQHIRSYFGVGQLGNWSKGEMISYHYALQKSREINNKRFVKTLIKIGQPPHNLRDLTRQRDVLLKIGGCMYNHRSYNKIIPKYLFSKEYNALDIFKTILGIRFSLKILWPKFSSLNLLEQVPHVSVPIYFLIGRHDYQVPFQSSLEYFEAIQAPNKEWIWFEKSGHNPMFEEVNRFNSTILKCISPN